MPILIHAGRGIPALGRDTLELAERYPGARLILAHAAVSDLAWLWRLMPEHPNLFIDTSWWNPADLIALFCLVPPGQILWASDSPYGQPLNAAAFQLRCALAAGLGSEAIALDRRRPDRAHPGRRGAGRRRPAARPARPARPVDGARLLAPADGDRTGVRRGRPDRVGRPGPPRLRHRGRAGAAGEEVIRLLDLADRHHGPPPPGRRFPPSMWFLVLALCVARTPDVALPDDDRG